MSIATLSHSQQPLQHALHAHSSCTFRSATAASARLSAADRTALLLQRATVGTLCSRDVTLVVPSRGVGSARVRCRPLGNDVQLCVNGVCCAQLGASTSTWLAPLLWTKGGNGPIVCRGQLHVDSNGSPSVALQLVAVNSLRPRTALMRAAFNRLAAVLGVRPRELRAVEPLCVALSTYCRQAEQLQQQQQQATQKGEPKVEPKVEQDELEQMQLLLQRLLAADTHIIKGGITPIPKTTTTTTTTTTSTFTTTAFTTPTPPMPTPNCSNSNNAPTRRRIKRERCEDGDRDHCDTDCGDQRGLFSSSSLSSSSTSSSSSCSSSGETQYQVYPTHSKTATTPVVMSPTTTTTTTVTAAAAAAHSTPFAFSPVSLFAAHATELCRVPKPEFLRPLARAPKKAAAAAATKGSNKRSDAAAALLPGKKRRLVDITDSDTTTATTTTTPLETTGFSVSLPAAPRGVDKSNVHIIIDDKKFHEINQNNNNNTTTVQQHAAAAAPIVAHNMATPSAAAAAASSELPLLSTDSDDDDVATALLALGCK